MKVILAKSAGFCWGVSRAVDRARSLTASGTVYTDGPLIHNNEMMKRLTEEGIIEAGDNTDLEGSNLVIRAHGIPPERRKMLEAAGSEILDATCPDVAKIQGLIRKHAKLGYGIIIYGDEGHAEVVGLLGFAEGNGHVVTCTDDVLRLPEMEKVCLVSQSTQFPSCYKEISDSVTAKYANAVILDTICEATRNRQDELVKIAQNVDVFVVVGGSHSANTLRLLELAKSLRPAIHIQTAAELKITDLSDYKTAGLTAGASTPEFIIREVKEKIESI